MWTAAFPGSNLTRPAVTELIEAIRGGAVERVVVYKLDRLSRSKKDTLYLIEDVFLPHGVDFVSINENIDTGSPYGRAMIGILSGLCPARAREHLSAHAHGHGRARQAGVLAGRRQDPFGYDYDAAKGILVPNSDADTVREIYARYLEGQSTGRIAASWD